MMKSLANVVGAKTARACDSCLKRRARWYCAADDAFLCQSCDGFVHSANPLARRHERVRLKTASPEALKHRENSASPPHDTTATWHHGFTRKARTPRGKKSHALIFHDLVPEISVEDEMNSYELEEQLICQVPELDPMVAELFLNDVVELNQKEEEDIAESCLNDFFPTDMDLEEFTTDVDTLLGRGLDTESYSMEDLGLSNSSEMFKIEEHEVEEERNMEIFDVDLKSKDRMVPCELSFGFVSHKSYKEDVVKNLGSSSNGIKVKKEEEKNVLMLRLNYDSVISTWGGQAPPWTSEEAPELDIKISGCPIISMREKGKEDHRYVGGFVHSSRLGDGGREARVSRYREKRRTRLFAKKIRYEVRKLNAEKRPRMKGRFVKRSSLVTANSPLGLGLST